MLTTKQEKFVQNIVKGMSQRQAYKDAYGATYDDNAIDNNASKMFNSTEVQTRYRELICELEDETIMSAKERMEWLSGVVKDINRDEIYVKNSEGEEVLMGSRNADLNTKIKAIDTLNKMSGEYRTILDGSVKITKLEDVLNES